MLLNKIKTILQIEDNDRDDILEEFIEMSSQRLKNRLGGLSVPTELEYIVKEMVIARFNRLSSEGLASEGTGGGSRAYIEDILDIYAEDIDEYRTKMLNKRSSGMRFI